MPQGHSVLYPLCQKQPGENMLQRCVLSSSWRLSVQTPFAAESVRPEGPTVATGSILEPFTACFLVYCSLWAGRYESSKVGILCSLLV